VNKLLSTSILLLVLLFLTANIGNAQFSSAIQGMVTDATGAAVPQATVTVKNVATGVSREATTSGEGFYRISNLGPGAYTVTAQKAGFSVSQRDGLGVGISEIARADFQLSVGAVTERVDVTAQALLLETEEGRVSGRIEQVQLREMPIQGRNILNLVALQAGITGRGISSGMYSGGGTDSFSAETAPQVYASGQRWDANNYTLDDTSTNGVARNGVTNLVPNEESVEEVRVVANNFSAVDGRSPGAQVQILTKGGTNDFHGALSYYFVNNTLAARTIFETTLPGIRKHQFGYAVGGPIVRNRTFFFTAFEGLRQGGTRASSYTVETPEFRDFVLRTRPNSIAAKVLKDYPPAVYPTYNIQDLGSPSLGPNNWSSTPDGIPDLGSVQYVPLSYRNAGQFNIRIDHELLPGKDRAYGSFYRTKNTTMTTSGIRTAFQRPQEEWNYYGNVNHSHIFSTNKINEFRAGVMQMIGRPDQFQTRQELLKVPSISITSLTGFGVSQYPNGWWQTNYHYKDIFSWIRSTHTLKMGGELRHMRASAQNTNNYIPGYSFASILDFADDEPLSMSRIVDPRTGQPATLFTQLRQTEWALFLQDDWKVNRRFTLNLGLRYENYGTFWDKENTLRNLVLGPGSNYQQRIGSGKVDLVKEFFSSDKNNLGPRFGFAWDPAGDAKTSVRGGYGLAYDRLQNVGPEEYRGNPPLRARVSLGILLGSPTFTYSMGDPSKPFLGYPVDPALRVGLDERNGIAGVRTAITALDPTLRNPYTQNWFFGVQRDLWGTLVEVNYMGSAGHKLFNAVNLNRYTGDMLDGKFDGFNPSFGSISMTQSTSNSIYHGATVVVKRRLQKGFMLQGNYTFGKVLDDTSATRGGSWQNAWDRRTERGLADFDVSQRVSLVGMWEMPFFKGRPPGSIVYKALGGWQLTGFGIFDNGTPMTVTTSAAWPRGDFNGDNAGGDRPNAPAAAVKISGWGRQELLSRIFKVADFPTPTPGTGGNLGRNTFRGPGFAQVDFSLAKRFAITERVTVLVRADAYNAFNRVNLNDPNLDLSNTNFGRSTGQRTARLAQAGLKIQF
jgi:hypothetical protein